LVSVTVVLLARECPRVCRRMLTERCNCQSDHDRRLAFVNACGVRLPGETEAGGAGAAAIAGVFGAVAVLAGESAGAVGLAGAVALAAGAARRAVGERAPLIGGADAQTSLARAGNAPAAADGRPASGAARPCRPTRLWNLRRLWSLNRPCLSSRPRLSSR